MIIIDIPGYGHVEIQNLVLDYNGTLAKDGVLIRGLQKTLAELAEIVNVYVITANTFGTVESELADLPLEIMILGGCDEREEKLQLIKKLGPEVTIAIGNGNNDTDMLRESIIGIGIIGSEGCSGKAVASSDILCGDIKNALELLINPGRLKATLRY